MDGIAGLSGRYDVLRRCTPYDALPRFDDDALKLGRGTALARFGAGDRHRPPDDGNERLAVLLSIAHRRETSATIVKHVRRSIEHRQRGDLALAYIELAFARLPPLAGEEGAFRLFLAAALLDEGVPPADLDRRLAPSPYSVSLRKYDPAQARVPAGSGAESGQWTSVEFDAADGGRGTATEGGVDGGEPKSAFLPIAAARTFLTGASPAAVEALALFASRFAVPTAILGALFIPTPNSGGVTEGTLPEAADIRYRRDGPAGLLRLARTLPDGGEAVVVAQNRRGLYYAGDTAIGRDLGGQLYLDLDTVTVALAARERPRRQATYGGPKLCPEPTPDTRHGASDDARDYEDDVRRRVNPIAPLPRGLGISAPDPASRDGKLVYFEDCFRYAGDLVDGDMKPGDFVEAKGPRKAYLYSKSDSWARTLKEDAEQARKQDRVAKARGVGLKWSYAEKEAADIARKRFEKEGFDITVGFMPPSRRPRRR